MAVAALKALANRKVDGINGKTVLEAMVRYGIDPEKPNPLYA